MSRPARPGRLRRTVLCSTMLALPALIPAAASADYTQANTWSGGVVSAARGSGSRSIYARRGVALSVVTVAPRARMVVDVYDERCGAGASITTATSSVAPGGQEFYESATAHGRRTQRYRSRHGTTKLTITVDLAPAAPGVMSGTVRVTGTARDTRRPYRCALALPVVVRSHQSLLTPLAAATTDPAVPRTGLVSAHLSPKVRGAIAITRRADGRLQALWSFREQCRAGAKHYPFQGYESAKRFAIRADGSFSGVERGRQRGSYRGDRYVSRSEARITGRIGPDGIARGRVSNTSSLTFAGGKRVGERCRTGSQTFVAAP